MQYAIAALEKGNINLFFVRLGIMGLIAIILLCMEIRWKPQLFHIRSRFRDILDAQCMPKIIYGDTNKAEIL